MLTKKQELAISSFEKSLKRIEKSGLKLMMLPSSCGVYFKKDIEKMDYFDHGWTGMMMKDGIIIKPLQSFNEIDS